MASAHGFNGGPLGKPFFFQGDGSRFDFFQAVRLAEKLRLETHVDAVRFSSRVGLEFPSNDLNEIEGGFDTSRYVLSQATLGNIERSLGHDLRLQLNVIEDQEFFNEHDMRLALRETLTPLDFEAHSAYITSLARQLSPVEMNINFMGLAGSHGPLPLAYTELLLDRLRLRDTGMRDFLDIFNHRLASLMYGVRKVHRPGFAISAPEENSFSHILKALMGIALPGVNFTQHVPWRRLLYYTNLFSGGSRTVDGLQRLLGHYFQTEVRVENGCGHWLHIDTADQTALGVQRTVLGDSLEQAALGRSYWSADTRIRVHLGPLSHTKFESLLDGQPLCEELRELIRLYVGPEIDFDIRLVLNYADTRATILRLPRSEEHSQEKEHIRRPRLGFTSFLKSGANRTSHCLTHDLFERLIDPTAPKYSGLESELATAPDLLHSLKEELQEVRHSSNAQLQAALRRCCDAYFKKELKRHARTRADEGGTGHILDADFFDQIGARLPGLAKVLDPARERFVEQFVSDPAEFSLDLAGRFLKRYGSLFAQTARKSAEGLGDAVRVPLQFFHTLRELLPQYAEIIARAANAFDATRQMSAESCLDFIETAIGRDNDAFYRDYAHSVRRQHEGEIQQLVEIQGDNTVFAQLEKRYLAYSSALGQLRRQMQDEGPGNFDDFDTFHHTLWQTMLRAKNLRTEMIKEIRADISEELREMRPSAEFFDTFQRTYPEAEFFLHDLQKAIKLRYFANRAGFIESVRDFLRGWRLKSGELYFMDRAAMTGEYGLPLDFFRVLHERGRAAGSSLPPHAIISEMRRALGDEFDHFTEGYRAQIQQREHTLFAELSEIQPAHEILQRASENFRTAHARGRDHNLIKALARVRFPFSRRFQSLASVRERLRARLSSTLPGARPLFPGYLRASLREICRGLRLRGALFRQFVETLPTPDYFAQQMAARLKAQASFETPEELRRALREQTQGHGSLYDELYRQALREEPQLPDEHRRIFLRAFQILRGEFPEVKDAVNLVCEEFDRHPQKPTTPKTMLEALPVILSSADTLHRLMLLRQLRRRLPEWGSIRSRVSKSLAAFEELAPNHTELWREARRHLQEYTSQNQFTYQAVLQSVLGPAVQSIGYRSFFRRQLRQQLQPVRRLYRLAPRQYHRLQLHAQKAGIRLPTKALQAIRGLEFESREQLEDRLARFSGCERLSQQARLLVAEAAEQTDFHQKPEFFYIGANCLRRLRLHVPAYLLQDFLAPLLNRMFHSRFAFLEALTVAIGVYNTVVYESHFLEHARVAYRSQPRYVVNRAFERQLHRTVRTRETRRAIIRRARRLPYMDYLDGEEIWEELSANLPPERRADPGLRWRVIQAALIAEHETAVVLGSQSRVTAQQESGDG